MTAREPAGGRILAITVCYETDAPGRPEQTMVDLEAMLRHCRPERVEDLLEDLTLLCEDVVARRQPEGSGRPVLAPIRRPK